MDEIHHDGLQPRIVNQIIPFFTFLLSGQFIRATRNKTKATRKHDLAHRKESKINSPILSDGTGINLEINSKRNHSAHLNTCRRHKTPLGESCVAEEAGRKF